MSDMDMTRLTLKSGIRKFFWIFRPFKLHYNEHFNKKCLPNCDVEVWNIFSSLDSGKYNKSNFRDDCLKIGKVKAVFDCDGDLSSVKISGGNVWVSSETRKYVTVKHRKIKDSLESDEIKKREKQLKQDIQESFLDMKGL